MTGVRPDINSGITFQANSLMNCLPPKLIFPVSPMHYSQLSYFLRGPKKHVHTGQKFHPYLHAFCVHPSHSYHACLHGALARTDHRV